MPTYRKLRVFNFTKDFQAATKVVEAPLVDPQPNEVRVRQIYAGVNPLDLGKAAGAFPSGDGKVPFDIGSESVGFVDAIGSSIPNGKFTKGQPVMIFHRDQDTGFSEYSYKPADQLIPIPEAKPEYLTALLGGLTGVISLDKCGKVKAGEKVLVTAAAGGTGQIVVQWAKKQGAYVIALTSTAEKAKYLKELGADFIINYREENLDQVLTDKFPDGIDVVWETIGGETCRILFDHLAVQGRLAVVGSISNLSSGDFLADPGIKNQNMRLLQKSQTLSGFMLGHFLQEFSEYLPQLIGGLASGAIKAQADLGERSPGGKFFGVDQVYRAQAWLHSGKNLGKVVVQLQNV